MNEPKNTDPLRDQLKPLKVLWSYLWGHNNRTLKGRVVMSVIFLLLSKIIAVCIPFLFKRSIDSLGDLPIGHQLPFIVIGTILAYGAARILSQLFSELKDSLFARVEQNALRGLALTVFRHLHALSLRFHLDRKTGGISRVIERGTKSIESFLRFMIFNIVPTFLEIILVSVLLIILFRPYYAIITMVTLVFYIVYSIWMTEWRTRLIRELNTIDADANGQAIDSLLNYETVKYFSAENVEAGRYDQSLKSYETAAIKSKIHLSILNMGQGIIISCGLIAVMMGAAVDVGRGAITTGDFVMLNTYLIQLYMPLNILGFAYREIKLALINMDQMTVLLNEPNEIRDAENAPRLTRSGGHVVFDNVHFSYNPDRAIIRGVSFDIPPGKTLAIVGPSGSGKTTISRLLYRFYDGTAGRILIDGQDIQTVTQNSLRSAIGIVPQDCVLFNDTLFYNIAYGRPDASPDDVIAAARLAHIDDLIKGLPDGYNTMVGERGLKLSGGEKQRVAIARTLLKNPQILIFDEATSALDTQTEKDIQKNLTEIARGKTTLIIAHRLSTITAANEILVLKDGLIVERGTHRVLLKKNGLYADMWSKQKEAHGD